MNKKLIIVVIFFFLFATTLFAKQVQVSVIIPGWFEVYEDEKGLQIWTNMPVWINSVQIK